MERFSAIWPLAIFAIAFMALLLFTDPPAPKWKMTLVPLPAKIPSWGVMADVTPAP